MVVGNGLLAQTFSHFREHESILVFASGVSNSRESNVQHFEREIDLLNRHLIASQKIIYFSTVSVYDPELKNSPYILHKKKIEEMISSAGVPFSIFRLPILVSHSSNPHTLTNFLYDKLIHHERIPVFSNARRYLMDASDAGILLTRMILQNDAENKIIDVNFDNAISIRQLISIFEEVTEMKASTELLDQGGHYETDNNYFIEFAKRQYFVLPVQYNRLMIEKYYGNKPTH